MYAELPKSVIKMERFVLRLRRRYGQVPSPSEIEKREREIAAANSMHRRARVDAVIAAIIAVSDPIPDILDPHGYDLF